MLSLKKIVDREATHAQWAKQLLNLSLLVCLIILNLFLGSKSNKSIVGIKTCTPAYWLVYIAFIVICALATTYAIWLARSEQKLKIQYGNVNMTEHDIVLSRKNIAILVCVGFFGGLIAGACGLGGGVLFNPAFLALGMPPLVASASGLYLVCFGKVASTVVYLVFNQLNISYGLWLSFCAAIGSVVSTYAARWYYRNSGRQSFIVWLLVFNFALGIVILTYFGVQNLKAATARGVKITAFSSVC